MKENIIRKKDTILKLNFTTFSPQIIIIKHNILGKANVQFLGILKPGP